MLSLSKRSQGIAALCAITALWGMSFPIVKNAVTEISPFAFLSMRFMIATTIIAIFIFRKGMRATLKLHLQSWRRHKTIQIGLGIGLILFCGFALQTFGLQTTSATNSAFLTGLCVIFVPLFGLFIGHFLKFKVALGVAIAAIGLWFLTGGSFQSLTRGDLLTILSAIAYAIHILLLAKISNQHHLLLLTCAQMAAITICSFVCHFAFEPLAFVSSKSSWMSILFTAVFNSAIPYVVQTYVQRFVPAVTAAMVFATEPIWGAIAAFAINGEILPTLGYWGGALMILGILIVEAPPLPKILRPRMRSQ
jgi:drug/metabolite transporter (DMT)-like permease